MKGKRNLNKKKNNSGITLVALIITIIVLLILAVVAIRAVTGDGIIVHAKNARDNSVEAQDKEAILLALNEWKIVSATGNQTFENFMKEKFGADKVVVGDNENEVIVTLENGKQYKIEANGEIKVENGEEPPESPKSYVGYYADIDGDGTVDGIIYADLAVGGSGQWGEYETGAYTIPKASNESELKDYDISDTQYTERGYGTRNILTINKNSTGTKERFYVMALADVPLEGEDGFIWYLDLQNRDESDIRTSEEFGMGRKNTEDMMAIWVDDVGGQGPIDVWSFIEESVEAGWFVPSRAELVAFTHYLVEKCGMTTSNYNELFGLSETYWSSSIIDGLNVCTLFYSHWNMWLLTAGEMASVRLSTTF